MISAQMNDDNLVTVYMNIIGTTQIRQQDIYTLSSFTQAVRALVECTKECVKESQVLADHCKKLHSTEDTTVLHSLHDSVSIKSSLMFEMLHNQLCRVKQHHMYHVQCLIAQSSTVMLMAVQA
eukprot:11302-Heterococcus_DN1.PRE.3